MASAVAHPNDKRRFGLLFSLLITFFAAGLSSTAAEANACVDDLAARAKGGAIQLTWTPVPDTARYDVLRSASAAAPFVKIAETQSSYSTYLDETVSSNALYYYQVERHALTGESCLSDVIAAYVPVGRVRLATVPDIVGEQQADAETAILAASLTIGTVTPVASAVVPVGEVISQDPPANSFVPPGFPVDFAVSTGITNRSPSIDSAPPTDATEGALYTYDVEAVDPDAGDILTYSLDIAPAGMSIDPTDGLIQWTPGAGQLGSNPVGVRVFDGNGGFATQSYSIVVAAANGAPSIISSPVTNATVSALYSYDVEAIDPNPGDVLTFSLDVAPAGMSIDPSSGLIQWIPDAAQLGSNAVSARVGDGNGGFATQSFSIDVGAANAAPSIISAPPTSATEGEPYTYDVEATDPNVGDVLTFSLDVAPTGMSIDPVTGLIEWIPNVLQLGNNPVAIRVIDGNGGFATQGYQVEVTSSNVAPVISSVPLTTATEDELYQYDVEASDANPGDTLTFSLDVAPAGMSIDPLSGLVEWTPDAGQVGLNPVGVRVSDGNGGFATQGFSIDVEFGNQAPTITSVPVTTATAGVTYTYDVEATDPNPGDVLTFSLDIAPAGMSIDPVSGLIDWTPAAGQTGANAVSARVVDGNGGFATQGFAINVETANSPPSIISTPPSNATVDSLYTYDVEAIDPDVGDTLNFSLDVAPAGMGIDPVSGLIEWTPNGSQLGVSSVTARVEDGNGGFATQSYNVNVDPANIAPVADAGPDAAPSVGDTVILNGSGSFDPDSGPGPLTFSWMLTAVPPGSGAALDDTSIAAPSFVADIEGSYTAELIVNDGLANSAPDSVMIFAIEPANNAPVADAGPDAAASVGDTVFLDGTGSFDPDGDPLTYTWMLTAVPPGSGAMLNNPALATPNFVADLAGSYTAELVVNDGLADSSPDSVTIAAAVPLVPVPDVVGLSQATAEADIVGAGLTVGGISTQSSDTVAAGVVISQAPLAGVNVASGSPVDLVVSTGPAGFTDALRPEVTVTASATTTLVGQTVQLQVTATDNVGVATVSLLIDGAPVPLDGMNSANFSSGLPGIFAVEAVAMDAAGNAGSADLELRFLAGAGGSAPTASITAPADGGLIDGVTSVVGTASDSDFIRYVLELSDNNTGQFFRIGDGDIPVVNGELGEVDPTSLRNGIYTLRLTVEDANGNIASTQQAVQVEGENSVGNFTLAFEDLVIPMSGIDIVITRVYDSRVKTSGDFGVGWRLVLNDFRIQENAPLADGWQQTVSGGFFPQYSVVPTRSHFVRVTSPDGETSRFDFNVTSPPQLLFPYSITSPVTVAFAAAAGSGGSLLPLDSGTQAGVNPGGVGDVELLEDDFLFNEYDPDRYRFTTEDGTRVVLRQSGDIESITDLNGNTLTFGPGGLIHSAGKSVIFARDGQGRITGITDPNGNVIQYDYDFYGDLVAVTDQEGNTNRMTYNSQHGMLDFIDARGVRPSRTEYDDDGRMVAIIDADGNRMEFDHDVDAKIEVIRDRNGNATIYQYDDRGNILVETNPLGDTEQRTYDANGNALSKTDALGNTMTFTYDANGNRNSTTDALGNVVSTTFNSRNQALTNTDGNGNTTSNTYDAQGNQTSITDPLGNVTTNSFDASGNRLTTTGPGGGSLSYTYDASGNALSYTDFAGTVTTYTYDDNGNRLTETMSWTDGSGTPVVLTTTFEYDALNRLVRQIDPLGNEEVTEYDAVGEVAATTDKNGNRTEFEYDDRKNLIRTVFPDGSFESYAYDAEKNRTERVDRNGNTTRYEYDAINRLVRTVYADGSIDESEYDAAGQRIASIDGNGNRTTYGYDAAGRQTSVTDALGNTTTHDYDGAGNRVSTTDALGRVTTFNYDAANRLVMTILPDGSSTSKAYDARGLVTSETDQAGNSTVFAYDALQRLISVTDPLGNSTQFTYDEMGNRTSQTDANGNVTRWTYDALGRTTSRTLPGGQTETFDYDAVGNVVQSTDFAGNVSTFAYDSNNRRTEARYADGKVVTYTWSPTGRSLSVTDSSGVTSHAYDSRDRLARTDNPDGSFIQYSYDLAGNRTEVMSPGTLTTYAYDALNRMSRVIDANGVTDYEYNAVGSRVRVDHANGNVTRTMFDDLNRLTNLVNEHSDGSIISSYLYTLDSVGNRLNVTEDSGRVVTYTYDALNRLLTETAPGRAVTYTYDGVGNRTTRDVNGVMTTNIYDANDRLLFEGSIAYTYDGNGNLASRTEGPDVSTYSYDVRGRLVSATESGTTVNYAYDDDGVLISSTLGMVRTDYLVDKNLEDTRFENSRVLEERQSGALQVSYTYGDDLLSQTRGPDASHYHYDGTGSTRSLVNSAEVETDTYTYDAFGELLTSSGSTANSYLFAGEQSDPNTGFYYLRARWYQPDVGRFLSLDPFPGVARDPLTLHKYLYASANPVTMVDPNGTFTMAGTMTGMSIRISVPAINYGLLLARIAATVRTVATAAVATCAASQAISTFTALNGPVPGCNAKGATVFFTGLDTPETTAHIASAMLGHPGPLNRISPKHRRGWLRSDPRCKGNIAAASGKWCDEYPFASTRQGGQANGASLRLVSALEQIRQGVALGSFYIACNIVPNDPIKSLFAVSFAPITSWSCGQ